MIFNIREERLREPMYAPPSHQQNHPSNHFEMFKGGMLSGFEC